MINYIKYIFLIFYLKISQVIFVLYAILKNYITAYPKPVRLLEERFSKFTGCSYSLMFCNATSAMEAALYSLGANDKTLVATSGFVIPSSYCPAVNFKSELHFIDISKSTLNIDIDNLQNLSPIPNILIVVHFYGNPCDMEKIMLWANKNKVRVIEDCSHAHGAIFKNKKLGTFGDIGVFSLQGAKAVSAGEGAIAISNCRKLSLKMASYGHQDSLKKFPFYENTDFELPPFGVGNKYRAHPIGACLALPDLKVLDFKNSIYTKWFLDINNLAKSSNHFSTQDVLCDSIIGGYCQGFCLIFKNIDVVDKFLNDAKKNRLNTFQRNYTDSITYYAKVSNNSKFVINSDLSNTLICFELVVFVPFYQFIFPSRWKSLVKIIKALN
jgi:dTDP-4-amino-4,6-dideoxygalactose transaminase